MNRPDLIIVGYGNGVMRVDLLESIRMVPAFKRAPDYLLFFKEMTRFSDVSMITITIDDPDYTSDDLYILFVTTPTERQHAIVNETVIEIEKAITAWFQGTLYLVDHSHYTTLCTIRKRIVGDNDEELESPVESVGSITDVLHARDQRRNTSSNEAQT